MDNSERSSLATELSRKQTERERTRSKVAGPNQVPHLPLKGKETWAASHNRKKKMRRKVSSRRKQCHKLPVSEVIFTKRHEEKKNEKEVSTVRASLVAETSQ